MKPVQAPTKSDDDEQANEHIVNEHRPATKADGNLRVEIDKPKITFQEHDPPTQPLPVLHLANTQQPDCIKCAQCTCVLRSTSVGQICRPIASGGVGDDDEQISSVKSSPTESKTRPNTATSLHSQQQPSTVITSSSSSSSTDAKAAAATTYHLHHRIHCPHHRSNPQTETTTHHLTNASPLLSYPKAISHNDASVFTRHLTSVEPSNQTAGLEIRRLSDSAALNSSANKPPSGPSSFMQTRRCVLRLDGCSYLIGNFIIN